MITIEYSNGYKVGEPIPNEISVFLAGPTPKSKDVKSWRPLAIETFRELNWPYPIHLYIPEPFDQTWPDYLNQVEWEHEKMNIADAILFWVPRDLETMPAFTTNVEFGYWMAKNPNKVYYGRPPKAPNCRYLDFLYKKFTDNDTENTLTDLIKHILTNV